MLIQRLIDSIIDDLGVDSNLWLILADALEDQQDKRNKNIRKIMRARQLVNSFTLDYTLLIFGTKEVITTFVSLRFLPQRQGIYWDKISGFRKLLTMQELFYCDLIPMEQLNGELDLLSNIFTADKLKLNSVFHSSTLFAACEIADDYGRAYADHTWYEARNQALCWSKSLDKALSKDKLYKSFDNDTP